MPISIMEAFQKTTEDICDWAKNKLAAGLDGKVDKIAGKDLSSNDYTTADRNKVENMATKLILEEGKLCLGNDDNEVVSNWVSLPSGGGTGSGSGSGGSNAVTLLPIGSTNLTVAVGKPANISFNFDSSEAPGYDGTMAVYVGTDDKPKGTETIKNGDNIDVDISKYLTEGVNEVKITCKDIFSNAKSLSYTIYVVALKITSTFNASRAYDSTINYVYTLYGAVDKTVHFILDGKDTSVNKGTEVGEKEQPISIKTHGVHTLEVYVTANINGEDIPSNKLVYDIIYVVAGYTDPIISSVYTIESIKQGELISIPFFVYDPSNSTVDVELTIKQGDKIYFTSTRTGVGQTPQMWSTRNYPEGDVTFIVALANNKNFYKAHMIIVVKSEVDVAVKEDFRDFQLLSDGKSNGASDRDVWADGNVTTTFRDFNWTNTGWVEDEDGDIALRLSGKAKATINFQPFATDSLSTGRTIEMKFAIRDVNDRKAIAINCSDGKIGFSVQADTTTLSTDTTSIKCQYTDEEKVHLALVATNRDNYRLLYIYLNGVLSAVKQYGANDSLTQSPAQYIEIGSEFCCVDLYMIRSYRTALNKDDIKNNYIASIENMSEKIGVHADNDIYGLDGALSFSKLKEKIPILVITGDLPQSKGDKKTVDISYTDPFNPQFNYEESAVSCDVQGTSSQYYIRKNYKIKTKKEHQFATGEMPGKVFTFKADYAEATSTHNTGNANYVHTLYGDIKVPPQLVDSRVRTTIYGHPCVIFHKKNSSDPNPVFLGKYNYNWDKGAENVYGFTAEYDPDGLVQSWEVLNNTEPPCNFLTEVPANWQDHLFFNEKTQEWEPKYFEARYPDGCEDITSFKRMHDWVVSTKGNVEKFRAEFEEYFDLDFCLIYYVYSFVMLMVDQRSKNMMLTTWDGTHWLPYFYDNDTCLGINNEGQLVFDYYHEDHDTHGDGDVFNGANSTLWTNFREAFPSKIQECYQKLRSDEKLTYGKIIEYFITNQSDKWSISIYNEDSDYKYISMLRTDNDAGNLNQVRGTGEEHLRYFVENRLMYCDSKWNATDYENDYIAFRVYTPKDPQGVAPSANITITPYSHIYAGVKFKANGERVKHRLTAGVPKLFEPPKGEFFEDTLDENESEDFNDTEAAIYGASQLSSLGDLSPLYLGYLDVSKATKLTELIIGSGVEGYRNTFFGHAKGLSVGANKLLRKIDVRNCPNFTDSLGLSQCPNIQEIYATGSGITGVELPESGYLRYLYLPSTITNLTIKNQQYIEKFEIEKSKIEESNTMGYANLLTLHVENAVNIPIEDIINSAPNLSLVRLVDVTWQANSEEELESTIEKFKSCNGRNDDGTVSNKAVVRGRVKVPSISDELFADIYDNFKDLIVESEGSGTKCVVRYLKYNGTAFYTEVLTAGASISTPNVSEEELYRPVDPADEGKMRYVFTGWDNLIDNIQTHVDVRPLYKKQYSVNFYKDVDITEDNYHCTQWLDEGNSATDPIGSTIDGVEIFKPVKTGDDNIQYEFTSWSALPQNVVSSHNVHAIYDTYYPVRFYKGDKAIVSELHETIWTKAGETATPPAINPTKASMLQYHYTFSTWNGDYTNVTEPKDIFAEYTSTIRKYTVYFCNGADILYTARDVAYNNTATYSGSTPVKQLSASDMYTSDDYEWTGKWYPEPIPNADTITTQGTGENKETAVWCYPIFKFTATLPDTWDDIANNVKTMSEEELFQRYPIGARKDLVFTIDGTDYSTVVEVIAHNHDDLTDGSGKAKLTFFTNELPNLQRPLQATRAGGWGESKLREYMNGSLFNALPGDESSDGNLQNAIKEVSKAYNILSPQAEIKYSNDKCWVPSDKEVAIVTYDSQGNIAGSFPYAHTDGQGNVYSDVFSDNASRQRQICGGGGDARWWTRSLYAPKDSDSAMAFYIWAKGSYGGQGSIESEQTKYYVAFGFCI